MTNKLIEQIYTKCQKKNCVSYYSSYYYLYSNSSQCKFENVDAWSLHLALGLAVMCNRPWHTPYGCGTCLGSGVLLQGCTRGWDQGGWMDD